MEGDTYPVLNGKDVHMVRPENVSARPWPSCCSARPGIPWSTKPEPGCSTASPGCGPCGSKGSRSPDNNSQAVATEPCCSGAASSSLRNPLAAPAHTPPPMTPGELTNPPTRCSAGPVLFCCACSAFEDHASGFPHGVLRQVFLQQF